MSTIKQRIKEIKHEIQKMEYDLTIKKNVLQELEAIGSKKSLKSSQKTKAPRSGSLAEYLVKVLSDSPVPMSVSQIVKSLELRGYKSNAKVGLNNLVPSSLTRRPDLFYRASHGVYGLKNKHQPLNTER